MRVFCSNSMTMKLSQMKKGKRGVTKNAANTKVTNSASSHFLLYIDVFKCLKDLQSSGAV